MSLKPAGIVKMRSPESRLATERHFSVQEVSEMWGISTATVRRLFQDEHGVLAISMPELVRNRKHKPHVLLRIPASVLKRVYEERTRGGGAEIKQRFFIASSPSREPA